MSNRQALYALRQEVAQLRQELGQVRALLVVEVATGDGAYDDPFADADLCAECGDPITTLGHQGLCYACARLYVA